MVGTEGFRFKYFHWESCVLIYTPHNRKTQIRQEIQAVNVDTLGKVFQNLKKCVQVCLDVKGDQFQHRL